MDELKKWLLNRINVAAGQARQPISSDDRSTSWNWQERVYAYEAVLEKIDQIESDGEFEKWYASSSLKGSIKNICRQSWEGALKHANKTGQENSPAQS